MKIIVLSKNDFNQLMVDNNITKDNINESSDFFISINDTEGPKSISYFQDVYAPNLLKLYFDDTVEDVDLADVSDMYKDSNINVKNLKKQNLRVMTEEQGRDIISFLDKVNDDSTLFIHCTAGQNRSGSVGKFAADYLEYGQKKLLMDNPYIKGNSVVTRILNKIWLWGHYD